MLQQFIGNIRSAPVWMGDFGGREHLMPFGLKLDAAQFTDAAGIPVTVDTAGAAGNATSIPITALAYGSTAVAATVLLAQGNVLIPAGTTLNFGGKKFATLTADAKYGDTALTVAAIPTAVVAGDKATFSRFGTLAVPSGTAVGRTFAERAANTSFGPAAAGDDEIFLVAFDVPNLIENNDATAYRPGCRVKENYLPDYTTLNTGANEVQVVTITGTPTGGVFTLSFRGADTTGIAFDAAASAVQTALRALGSIGGTNVTASGSAGGPYTVTFASALAGTPVDLLGLDVGGLTGGTPGGSVTRSTAGGTGLLTKLRALYQCYVGVD